MRAAARDASRAPQSVPRERFLRVDHGTPGAGSSAQHTDMHTPTASGFPTLLLVGALTVLGAGCSGGSGNPPGFETAGGDFLPVRAAPSGGSVARLNDPVTVDFTTPIDIASADPNSIQFQTSTAHLCRSK